MKNPFPDISPELEDEEILPRISNAVTLTAWFSTNPDMDSVKRAAVLEAKHKKRLDIINRILGRLSRMEKAYYSAALMGK